MAFIVNRYGILHSYPDGRPLPVGARRATDSEIAVWERQDIANKTAIRADKRAKAAARAQLVVMNEPAKDDDDAKPPAKR